MQWKTGQFLKYHYGPCSVLILVLVIAPILKGKGDEIIAATSSKAHLHRHPPPPHTNASSSSSSAKTLITRLSTKVNPPPSITQSQPNLDRLLNQLRTRVNASSLHHLHQKQRRLLGVNKIASGIPTFITNNTRLKRQLEGIFHVSRNSTQPQHQPYTFPPFRPTSTSTTPPPTTRSTKNGNGRVVKFRKEVTKKENEEDDKNDIISSVSNPFHSTKVFEDEKEEGKPRNFTLEIVEIARKTVTLKDNNDNANNDKLPSSNNDKQTFEFGKVKDHKRIVLKRPGFPLFKRGETTTTASPSGVVHASVKYKTTTPGPHRVASAPAAGAGQVPSVKYKAAGPSAAAVVPSVKYKPASEGTPRVSAAAASPGAPSVKYKPGSDGPPRVSAAAAASPGGEVPSVKYKPRPTIATITTTGESKVPSRNAPSVKYKSTTTSEPIFASATVQPISIVSVPPIIKRKQFKPSPQLRLHYDEQIPYNEGDDDVDDADLKSYLDGHSTFGARGGHKHQVTGNITRYTPPEPVQVKSHTPRSPIVAKKIRVPIKKRNLQNRAGTNNEVIVEKADVEMKPITKAINPKTTVYTATGVPILENEGDKGGDPNKPKVFQYSGNQEQDKPGGQFPKLLKATLDELYRQGHPAVAKAPQQYDGGDSREREYIRDDDRGRGHFTLFNPLVDEPPLKFDPASNDFYGNPSPDGGQSRRREITAVHHPQEVEQQQQQHQTSSASPLNPLVYETTTTPFYHQGPSQRGASLEPEPEYEFNEQELEGGRPERDPYGPPSFIKDFVSLDNNFQPLPRPTKEEESFRDLVPPEARSSSEAGDDETDETDGVNYDPESESGANERDPEGRRPQRNQNNNRRGPVDREYDRDLYTEDDYEAEYGPTLEDFDKSYVDALQKFDDEIKTIEEHERSRDTRDPQYPPSSTGEPLVITSPGPTVSYNRNAPPPSDGTTPVGEEEEEEEEEAEEPPPPRSRESGEDDRRGGGSREEEEETEEPPARSSDEKDADGTEDAEVKIHHVHSERKNAPNSRGNKKGGNLDEDIRRIEAEFARTGVL